MEPPTSCWTNAWLPAGSQQIEFFRARHQIGDTRRHVVQCTPVATSRFAPYFTERRTVGLSGTSPVGVGRSIRAGHGRGPRPAHRDGLPGADST